VPGAWIAVVAIHQIPDALTSVHRGAATMRAVSTPFGSVNADTLVARIAPSSFNWLATAIGPAAGNAAHGVLNLSIALLGLYFLLISGDAAWSAVRRRLPFSAGGSDELRTVFGDVTRATVLGAILSAALQGLSIGVGLRLIGNDAPAFWGIVGGFTTLVPVVGNALVWVPAVVVQLIRGDYTAAIIMITLGKLIPSLLDRLTRARISRRLGNTHPMITLLGVLAGVRLIGAAGVLAGPALLRCSFTLVDLYEREYGLPWTRARSSENIDPDS
jgi:predicted PurR-regulated permease PerM